MAKKANKDNKGNYFQESYQELKKVSWPTQKRAIRLTILVLGFVLVTAIFIGILDYVFGFGYRQLIDLAPEQNLPTATQHIDTGSVEGEPIEISIGEDGEVIGVPEGLEGELETVTTEGGEPAEAPAPAETE
ncbi:preprotein translocase subunit SecE [Candidatus Peregrinibacteria bacterium]|nr:preprotein translocase subunit SecE [Candidatus Peregrinibacteria bacterium]